MYGSQKEGLFNYIQFKLFKPGNKFHFGIASYTNKSILVQIVTQKVFPKVVIFQQNVFTAKNLTLNKHDIKPS